MATNPSTEGSDARARLIHREIVQLFQLGVLAVAAFFVTRALAASNRETTRRNGAEWYERGSHLAGVGDMDRAVQFFRRATVTNRHEPKYVLALADALARQHQPEPARAALLALRESMPEHPDVNLQLARLAAARHDVAEAVSFYHNTLYAPWRATDDERRRGVRLELVDFLLAHGHADGAIPELVALATDIPDEPATHLELGSRFASAGDWRNALAQFQSALRQSPRHPTALAGAGEAAFELGDYAIARRYFRSTHGLDASLSEKRELVELIIAGDPLAPRIGAAERRRRLAGNIAYATGRLAGCVPAGSDAAAGDAVRVLQARAQTIDRQLQSRAGAEMDTIEDGVELVGQMEAAARRECAAVLRDRALLIIAQRHGADRR